MIGHAYKYAGMLWGERKLNVQDWFFFSAYGHGASMKRQRIIYLDIARCIAILSISLNHAVNRTYTNYVKASIIEEFHELSRASIILKTVVTVFSRIGAPLFLMITGALILGRKMETKDDFHRFMKHNFLSLFVTTEFWLFLGYWFHVFFEPSFVMTNVSDLVFGCIKTMLFMDMKVFSSMWYLQMILPVYLLLPVLNWFLHHSPVPSLLMIPAGIVVLLSFVIPTFNVYLPAWGMEPVSMGLSSDNLFSLYLVYILAGYWIHQGMLDRIPVSLSVLFSVTAYVLSCHVQYYDYSWTSHLVSYTSPGILLCSIFLFDSLRRIKAIKNAMISGCVSWISRISFAIYLAHVFIVQYIYWYQDFAGWHRSMQMAYLEAVSVGGSILIIWLLSHIRICREKLFLIK